MAIQKFVYNELQVKINDAESHYYKNNYRRQLFYENDFLCYINTLGIEGTYLDIGTNIGNHLVYLGLFTSAEKVLDLSLLTYIKISLNKTLILINFKVLYKYKAKH